MDLQAIFDLAEICHQKGIKHAVISPGSRNAPLTLAFVRHPEIQCYSVPDERSAAFIGLGMSLKTKQATVLICTSGSAALNYAPAVAEAFFSQVPLLVLTADRPPEWIDQLDGQTIYQESVYGKHVKKSFTFPNDSSHENSTWYDHRVINEAVNLSHHYPKGPVHINLPFREPFYPTKNISITYSEDIKIITNQVVNHAYLNGFESLKTYSRIVIIGGQHTRNMELTPLLSELSDTLQIPIIVDVIANQSELENGITHQDGFLRSKAHYQDLKPDLIITFGLSVISKNLKLFLRAVKPDAHWHIQEQGSPADTFQCLSQVIHTTPLAYFTAMTAALQNINKNELSYYQNWQDVNVQYRTALFDAVKQQTVFNEFSAYQKVLSAVPRSTDLHLANSMAVRYVNLLGIETEDVSIYCNRGTSGIDGSNSSALGFALQSDRLSLLLTGDMAFLYDRNAFWHNHLPKNLKIIVFNNHGGGIFRMIDGPRNQPELETYFETNQKSSAEATANEFGFDYVRAATFEELDNGLSNFFAASDKPTILEIVTDAETNQKVYSKILAEC